MYPRVIWEGICLHGVQARIIEANDSDSIIYSHVLKRIRCEVSREKDAMGNKIWVPAIAYTSGNTITQRESVLLAAIMDKSSI